MLSERFTDAELDALARNVETDGEGSITMAEEDFSRLIAQAREKQQQQMGDLTERKDASGLQEHSALSQETSTVTHVIAFSGEGASVILCRGWENCKREFFDAVIGPGARGKEIHREEVELWEKDFANLDNWSVDEGNNPFCFFSDIGETSHVRIYVALPEQGSTGQEGG